MTDNHFRADIIFADEGRQKVEQRVNLLRSVGFLSEAEIDQFNADGAGVRAAVFAAPETCSGMVGAFGFIDQFGHFAFFINNVMGTQLIFMHVMNDCFNIVSAAMQNNHIYRGFPFVKVGQRLFAHQGNPLKFQLDVSGIFYAFGGSLSRCNC